MAGIGVSRADLAFIAFSGFLGRSKRRMVEHQFDPE
jgi:hypothetical protein